MLKKGWKTIVQEEVKKGSEAWNVAQGYTQLKILKPLVEMDKLVKIAIYGAEEIDASLTVENYPGLKEKLRIEAINRLTDILREVVENSQFACNKADSKETLEKLFTRIKEVEKVLPGIQSKSTDQRTGSAMLTINEEHFNLCLEHLRKIKEEIPTPLNQNNLIFPSSEEIDLDKIKKQIIEGG